MKVNNIKDILLEHGFGPFMGVPCSVFKDLINYLEDNRESKYYLTSSEGEAMGLAGGFSLAGKIPVVLMQNDGYGNAVNPLSSLQLMYKLPCLLLISWRGEPGTIDALQHRIMGNTIKELLSIFEIPFSVLNPGSVDLEDVVLKAKDSIEKLSVPYAMIVKKGYFEKYAIKKTEPIEQFEKRILYLKLLKQFVQEQDIVIGATGFSGRELYQAVEHKGKFYMMGSMGYAASIGMGLAIENQERKVFVLDGDGAMLMHMGNLSTIGYYAPNNLIHICFDNNQYESTGGQKTASSKVDFVKIAEACGYLSAAGLKTLDDFKKIMKTILRTHGPHFVNIRVQPGTIDSLKRPDENPEEIKQTLMDFLKLQK